MKKSFTPVLLKKTLPLGMAFTALVMHAQTRTQAEAIKNRTNVPQLNALGSKIKKERPSVATLQAAAQRMNVPYRGEYQNMVYQLKDISKGNKVPLYYATQNVGAAQGTGTNKLNSTAGVFNLDGQGMTLYEWDGGKVLTTHQEFGGRVVQKDAAATLSDHSTHVAGTMVATGIDKAAKGMAPKASLNAYEWTNDETEMIDAAANAALVSNHSYGYLGGFEYGNWSGTNAWHWFGTDDETEYSGFGKYSSYDSEWDLIANNAPYYLPVKAAGNPRGNGPASGGSHYVRINNTWTLSNKVRQVNGGTEGFDCVIFGSTAKNILTVGAAHKLANGYNSPADVKAASFSGFGPTDDGRIKPDIAGIGVDIYSTLSTGNTTYSFMSGTSMASPNVTGSLGLLQQHYKNLNADTFMKAATLKALAIGTAKEAGNPGPDYSFGWGLLDAYKAAQTISTNNKYSLIQEKTLANGATDEISFTASGTEPIVATIVWNDPAPEVTADETPLNDRKIMLVNDLDARISSGSDTFMPWVMDPDAPNANATKGDNIRDNVEQVVIPNPVRGTTYTLKVSHKGTLKKNVVTADAVSLTDATEQNYSVVVTGISNNVNTDLELKSFKVTVEPKSYSSATPTEAVVVNQGASDVSNAQITYTLTDTATGTVASTGTVPVPTIVSGASSTVTFPVDLSKSFTDYQLSAEITLAADEVAVNNKQIISVFGTLADLTPLESSHTFGFEQDFIKYGWISEDTNADGRTWYKYDDASFARTGGSFAINFPNLANGTNDWLFSNPLKMKAGGKYRVIFYTRKIRTNDEKLNVSLGTSPESAAMTALIAKDVTATTAYVRYVYEFSPTEDNVYYLGFQHNMPTIAQTYAVFLDDVKVEQSEKPVVDFTASKTAVTTFDDVTLTPNVYTSAANPVSSYQWTFTPNTVTYQNGTSATSSTPVVRFNAEGTYTVALTVDNGKGTTTTEKTAYIAVKNVAPTASFTSDYTDVYKNGVVTFSDTSTGSPAPNAWNWEITPTDGVAFINGTSATSKNPIVSFANLGKYTVKLTATSPIGSNSVTKSNYVNVINVNPVRSLTGTADASKNVTLKWVKPVIDTKFYIEGFEGTAKLSAVFDEDGDGKNWATTSTTTYIRSGAKAAISYSWSSATNAHDVDNWIVTSLIPKGAEQLSFWIKHPYKEQMDVYVVRKENVAGAAPTLAEVKAGTKIFDDTTTLSRTTFKNIIADLKPYSNSSVFIAFHHKSRVADDGFYLVLDDIEVGYDNKLPAAKQEPLTVASDGKHVTTPDGQPLEAKNSNAIAEPILTTYAAQPAPAFSSYEVKRDGTTVATITDLTTTTFSETVTEAKAYTYDVYANYSNGLVSDKQSVIVDLSTLATVEMKSVNGVAVYPNPSSGPFTIVAGQDVGKFDAQVFDMSGKSIMTKKSNGKTLDIDLTSFGRGIYILNVTDSNGKITSVKLMVK